MPNPPPHSLKTATLSAGLEVVRPQFLAIAMVGAIFFAIALALPADHRRDGLKRVPHFS